MNIKIGKSKLSGALTVISSKSDAHRLMIGAALAKENTTIHFKGWSEDMEATKDCLEALGAKFTKTETSVTVQPVWGNLAKDAILDCNESGSTVRFLLPVAAALGCTAMFEGRGRLPERPLGVLLDQMRLNGNTVDEDKLPLVVKGGMQGGVFTLPANISSQYITGLLFALPLLQEDSEIRLTTEMASRGYVDLTLQVLSLFGINIEETENSFYIKGGQTYQSPKEITAEGDWSGAAFWVVAGACGGEIYCKGVNQNSPQGDKEIVSLMEQFGAEVFWEEDGVRILPKALRGITIDATQIPDLVPILCVTAALAEGTTEIINAGRLRIKESDRLQAMAEGLTRLGVKVEEKPEGIVIEGGATPPTGEVTLDGYADHRIVMSMAVAAALIGAEAVIEGAEAVSKSYPSFFAEFVKLGGVADVV